MARCSECALFREPVICRRSYPTRATSRPTPDRLSDFTHFTSCYMPHLISFMRAADTLQNRGIMSWI